MAAVFVTAGAGRDTFIAVAVTADTTGAATLAADFVLALGATGGIVGTDDAATVVAAHAFPVRKRDVGRVRVVTAKDAIDDAEEIEQAAFTERSPNHRRSFALAELFHLHVRVRRAVIGACRIGIGCDDVIGRRAGDVLPVQLNVEATEIHVLQDDVGGTDGQSLASTVDRDHLELVAQRAEVLADR